jgi:hypothetical protein
MSKSAPKAPDYAAAAEQQAQGSREVTEQQTWANRPDQFTPFGNTTWQNQQVWDPSTQQYLNRWAQTTELNPESQRALDAQLGLTTGRSELGASLLPRAQDEFGQAIDWSKFQQGGQGVQAPGAVQGGPIAGAEGLPQANLTPEQLQRGYDIQGPELDPSQRYYQNANEAIYNQWADRALPQQARETDALRTQLYNMGLKEGDPGYDEEMRKLRESQGDQMRQAQYQATIGAGSEAQRMLGMDAATRAQLTGEQQGLAQFGNQAALGQFGMGAQAGSQNFAQQLAALGFGNEAQQQAWQQQMAGQDQNFQQQMQASQYQTQLRQQQIAEEMQKRGWSLNEINALISGQQVGMPSMPGFNTAQRAEGNQALQAAQLTGQSELDRYNAQQAATQGMMSGIGSMAGGFMMSDRKFKRDIVRVGSTAGGTPLYKFRYIFGGPEMVGVMADEVPHAVTKIAGISFVDYSKVK